MHEKVRITRYKDKKSELNIYILQLWLFLVIASLYSTILTFFSHDCEFIFHNHGFFPQLWFYNPKIQTFYLQLQVYIQHFILFSQLWVYNLQFRLSLAIVSSCPAIFTFVSQIESSAPKRFFAVLLFLHSICCLNIAICQ